MPDFDPFDPNFIMNPYPTFERLRQEVPIFWHESGQMWYAMNHEDVSALLRDRRLGRSILHVLSREEVGLPEPNPAYAPFYKLSDNSMFDKEPPDHTRLRSLVHKVFTPRRVESLRGQIEKVTNELLDQVEGQGHLDLLEDYATPLPVTVIAEMLGIPEADRHLLRPWSQSIVAMYELDHTPEQAERAIQAATDFSDYLRDLAAERRENPQDDLITALVQVEDGGDKLSVDELISTCVLLLNAGHEATVNVVGNGMLALLRHPEEKERLLQNPELFNSAIEEMMRYDSPLQLFRRWILEDVEYKGHQFKQGQEIALLFGAANRDPNRFENADQFDITRNPNPHITFGGGVHYCLGAPLARLELQVAIPTLLKRFPNLHILGDEPQFRNAFVIRGLEAFHVGF